jgi:importin subunit alpha-6/7
MEVLGTFRLEVRNSEYQKSFCLNKLIRKREESAIQLRKLKRKQHLAKKRAVQKNGGKALEPIPEELLQLKPEWVSAELINQIPSLGDEAYSVQDRIELLINFIKASKDSPSLLDPLQTLRKIISSEKVPPIYFIMKSGISMKLISLLNFNDPEIQYECLWCVLNLLMGPIHIGKLLMGQGIITSISTLLTNIQKKLTLDDQDKKLLDLCVWCIANLAADTRYDKDDRDQINSFIPAVLMVWKHLDLRRNVSWAISNLCRDKPLIGKKVLDKVLLMVHEGLESDDEEIVLNCCWALACLSDEREDIEDIINLDTLKKLLTLLGQDSSSVTSPCLRALGNIVAGNNSQTQLVLDLGLVDKISVYLSSTKVSLKKETLWILSNITAGTDEQINLVLSHPCIHQVISCLNDPNLDIKKEALWVISNSTYAKSSNLVLKSLEFDILSYFSSILDIKDACVLLVALNAISNIFRSGKLVYCNSQGRLNEVAIKISEIGMLDKIEELQHHPNSRVYDKIVEIMQENYEVEADININPEVPEIFSFN